MPILLLVAMVTISGMGCAGQSAVQSDALSASSKPVRWQAKPPATLTQEAGHLRLREVLPDGPRVLTATLDRASLDAIAADTFVMDLAIPGSEVAMTLEIFGYPAPTDHRRYYLRKLGAKGPGGGWQRLHLNLAMDDDTFPLKEPRQAVEVVLTLPLNAKGVTDANATLDVLVGQSRFIGSGMTLEASANGYDSQVNRRGDLIVTHRLTLRNTGQAAREVKLELDRARLKHFTGHAGPSRLRLEAGATVPVTVTFILRAEAISSLPALYAEPAALRVVDAGDGELLAQPLLGYAPADLYAVVPPADRPHPWFTPTLTPEQAQAYLATPQGKRLLADATERLAIDPTPPALLHGNPNHFFDPQTNSQMRYHGIGKVWSEGRKAYVDVTDMPEHVRKAEAYAHHTYLAKAALILAQAGHVTGDQAMSRKAADILLAYAERYPHYPSLNPRSSAFHARVGWAMLQDAWWIESVIEAADLVLGAGVLTDAQARAIREDLMAIAALTLRTHRVESNQQSEVNAGYGGAALVARRFDLAAEALDSQGGVRTQWRYDFDEDGYSIERDQAYHYAALAPMTRLADQLSALGVAIYDDTFKKLFVAPLARSLDGRAGGPAWVYRSAARHWPDEPAFVAIARQLPPSIESVAHPLPTTSADVTVDRIATLPSAGYSVLRQIHGQGLATHAATMNWGSPVYRGGIVLLSPSFHVRGQPLNAQMTRIAYGYKESGFSYTAVAGNSLTVDGQAGSLLSAEFVAQVTSPGVTGGLWRRGDDRPGWRGVRWSRAVVLLDAAAVVVDLIDADQPHTFDFLWMLPVTAMGKTQGQPDGADAPALLEQGHGYDMLRDPRHLGQADRWSVTYPVARHGRGHFQGIGQDVQWLSATSRTGWHPKDAPLHIMRLAKQRQGWLATVWSGVADRTVAPRVTVDRLPVRSADGQAVPPHEALALRVTCDGRSWRVLVTNDTAQGGRLYQVDGQAMAGPLAVMPADGK